MSGHIPLLANSHSLVFLLNSRLGHFSAPHLREDPLSRSYRVSLPSSLAVTHSSTFGYSPRPPVSVSGTGRHGLKLSGFSREPPSPRCPLGRGLAVLSRFSNPRGLPCVGDAFALQPAIPSAGGGSGPPSPLRSPVGYGNVDPLPIGATPPLQRRRLRSRLTLIRLALIRKPWSSGVGVSRPHCRYSCLHLLFRTLQRASRRAFRAVRNAPLPMCESTSRVFGGALHARSLSIPVRSTGELLRTL